MDVYYWTLPNGLRVVEESFSGEGNSSAQLVYAYAMRDGNKFRMGMAIRRGVTYLHLGQIDPYIYPDYQDHGFSVTNSDSMLRAARYQCDQTINNSDYDNSLSWTITDNYGCVGAFILRANSADKGATLRLFNKDPQQVMREFQIGIVGTTASATDALYANGRQQCRLVIKVLKGVPYNDGASWDPVPLSEREKESLTVLPYSNQLRPPQAWGWYCDDKPNQYQEGLRPGTASVEQAGAADEQPSAVNTTGEEIYRYMRCNGGQAPIQPQKFMACITLDDGTQYSTHMDNADAVFESSITISPQQPYYLRVSDLRRDVQRVYPGVNGAADVDAYYWTLPSGLKVVEQSFSGEGKSTPELVYAYAMKEDRFRMGMAVEFGVTYLTLGQIDPDVSPSLKSQGFSVVKNDSMLRALRYQCLPANTTNKSNYDNSLLWIITDNYGCQSSFILRANPADSGATLQLLNNDRMKEFQIGIAAGGAVTDALYANGRQQCKVFVRILRTTNVTSRVRPLSATETASITVLPYSNDLRPSSQAQGWYCDVEPNEYDQGLWRGTGSVGLTGTDARTAAANVATQQFYRYMRFNGKQTRIQPTRFMACITLDDGTQYSTHMQQEGGSAIESSIVITPQVPYAVHVNDLTHERQDAYTSSNVDVDTYYWTLPGGLRIVGENFSGAGQTNQKLSYAYDIFDGWLRLGVAIKANVTSLTLGDIENGISGGAQVPIINSNSMLRGARYSLQTSATTRPGFNNLMYWTITDNYGCESRFVLKANNADKGNRMELLNG